MSGFDGLTDEVESLVEAVAEGEDTSVRMVQIRHESGIATKVKPTIAEDKPDNMVEVGLWSHPLKQDRAHRDPPFSDEDYKYTEEERAQYRNELKGMVREAGFSILGEGGGE